MNTEEKAAAWDRISEAWLTYCQQGVGVFDWDFDSRDVMSDLTGHHAFEGWPFSHSHG